ncbi:class I adenylate-forming enzyme family protein [Novosphingobium sp.]|uniref:class I adenylate-forming enzyme family protein n=1 Tax=Novosphingobium sp. TaxID=1874826 RepID=UPI002639D7E8|nr:class I adenylate-forming enzyme family protein [Novosphingobium sp.]
MQPPISRTFPELLRELAATEPERCAVIDGDVPVTYAGLAQRARLITNALRAAGVQRGERIGVLLSNRIEWLEIFLGASAAGAVVVPISTWSKPAELAFILGDAHISALFAMPSSGKEDFFAALQTLVPEAFEHNKWASAGLPHLRQLIAVAPNAPGPGWRTYEAFCAAAPDAAPDAAPGEGPNPADDALILYTSGSTSKPKAVRLAHGAVIENGFNIGERMGLGRDDRVFVSAPLFWAYGSANALPAAMSHGAAIILQERFEPGEALALIEQHRCTAIYTLPTMTAALVAHPDFATARTASLRTGLTIGSPQDVIAAATQLGAAHICNIYGSSETCGNCCVTPWDWPLERRAACQGPPLPGVSLRFIDAETGVEADTGQPGLIEVTGYLMSGYGGQSIAHNVAAFTADGWYRTGDLGQLTDTGDLIFLGRATEMIKRAGINVSPAEVEDVLLQHTAVAQAAVVGAPDPARGEIIVAFVVAAQPATEAELIAHARGLSSTYKVPDRIVFRNDLPATSTGKLQRQPLKAEAAALTAKDRTHVA